MKKIILPILLCLGWVIQVNAKERVISTSPYITQIVEALGVENQLVGVDTTSRYNDYLKKIPDVGYRIALSTEGMLSLKPTLVLWSSDSGPSTVVEKIKGSGISSVTLVKPSSLDELKSIVAEMAELFKEKERGQKINDALNEHYQTLDASIQERGDIKTLFLMEEMGGSGSKSFAGGETSANNLIELLGLSNPFAAQFKSYKGVNLEIQIQQNAKIVLIGKRKDFAEKNQPIIRKDPSVVGWPKQVAPQCVFEVDISHLLVYGIYLYDNAVILNEMINDCLQGQN